MAHDNDRFRSSGDLPPALVSSRGYGYADIPFRSSGDLPPALVSRGTAGLLCSYCTRSYYTCEQGYSRRGCRGGRARGMPPPSSPCLQRMRIALECTAPRAILTQPASVQTVLVHTVLCSDCTRSHCTLFTLYSVHTGLVHTGLVHTVLVHTVLYSHCPPPLTLYLQTHVPSPNTAVSILTAHRA